MAMGDHETSATILVVDDEAATRFSLAELLRMHGYHVATAASGEEALALLSGGTPVDLMLLDIKMPGISGLEVIEAVSKQFPGIVVILLTAFGTLDTAIHALRHGAHDYLLKPCPIPDILQSVRKGLARRQQERQRQQLVQQLRRTLVELTETGAEASPPPQPAAVPDAERFLRVRDLVLDRQKHEVLLNGRPLDLTPTEFEILACLMGTPDRVWSPQEIVTCAQGYETDPWSARAIVRVHVRRLRKKVEADPADPQYILNVRGVGYMLASTPPRVT